MFAKKCRSDPRSFMVLIKGNAISRDEKCLSVDSVISQRNMLIDWLIKTDCSLAVVFVSLTFSGH